MSTDRRVDATQRRGLRRFFCGWALCLGVVAPVGVEAADARPKPCTADGDCPQAQLCARGTCRPVDCRQEEDCPSGRLCRAGACRMRDCRSDLDCNIERRCVEGICALPGPEPATGMPRPGGAQTAGDEALTMELTAGPAFPLGLLVELGVRGNGGERWSLGVGTSHTTGGVGLRLQLSRPGGKLGPLLLDWAAGLLVLRDDAAPLVAPRDAWLGTGRWLFERASPVTAAWLAFGAAMTLPHGRGDRRRLIIDLGGLLLLHGQYRPATEVALVPSAALRYGVAF